MNLLLDTHTLLWFLDDDPQLAPTAKIFIWIKRASNGLPIANTRKRPLIFMRISPGDYWPAFRIATKFLLA